MGSLAKSARVGAVEVDEDRETRQPMMDTSNNTTEEHTTKEWITFY